jgi:hypothetical protein
MLLRASASDCLRALHTVLLLSLSAHMLYKCIAAKEAAIRVAQAVVITEICHYHRRVQALDTHCSSVQPAQQRVLRLLS